MKKVDPLMFKIVKDLETTDILDDLNLVVLLNKQWIKQELGTRLNLK